MDQWKPLRTIDIRPSDDYFHILQNHYHQRFDESHYTKWELACVVSGIRDASIHKPAPTNCHPFYRAGYLLHNLCTERQREILILYVVSGMSQQEIKHIKKYHSHNTVPSFLKAIRKKAIFPNNKEEEKKIIDTYTGRYEDETVTEWFERMNNEQF